MTIRGPPPCPILFRQEFLERPLVTLFLGPHPIRYRYTPRFYGSPGSQSDAFIDKSDTYLASNADTVSQIAAKVFGHAIQHILLWTVVEACDMTREDIQFAELDNGFDDILSPASENTQKASAFSNKLSNVLARSFADAEIREALAEFDDRRIRNTAPARRRLRTNVQKNVIDCNGDIVKDFGQVATRLKSIGATIANLNHCCEDMRQHMLTAQRESSSTLEDATTLISQKAECETKQQLLQAFSRHFSLNSNDQEILTSFDSPVDERFFSLLARLKSIHSDCETLLGSDDQQLGMELIERTAKQLESAFQKLFRWTQKEFQKLDLENPQMSVSIRRALRVLAERPTLFEACLDFFAEARERDLSEAFYAALTGFNNQTDDRTAKPMDYYAHDSLRFVGDMLAWTHSAAVSEREALEVLFISEGNEMAAGIRAGLESEPWHQSKDANDDNRRFDGKAALEQLLNRDLAGVARALRQRIEQTIQGDEDVVLVYKIAHLIDFYRVTFQRLLGDGSAVISILSALHESAMSQFRSLMYDDAQTLPQNSGNGALEVARELSAPDFLLGAVDRLQQVVKSFDASFAADASREAEFVPILDLCLEPYLQACTFISTESQTPLREPALSIFMLNVFKEILPVLSRFDFTSTRRETIQRHINENQRKLAEHQFHFFLDNSGLRSLYESLRKLSASDPSDLAKVSTLKCCQPTEVIAASQTLDEFLPDALVEAQEELRFLQDKNIVEAATGEAAGRFCEIFDQIEERLIAADEMAWGEEVEANSEESSGVEDRQRRLRVLFPRTGAEIRVLLS